MDPNLSRIASKRIVALFSSKQRGENLNFSEKNRNKELKRLAKQMEMDVPKLKELLKEQRGKMDPSNPKGKYIEWILEDLPVKKSDRKGSVDSEIEEKKFDVVDGTETNGQSSEGNKKRRVTRPQRPTTKERATNVALKDQEITSDDAAANILTSTHFADLKDLHPASKRGLKEVLKLKAMTEIQAKTFLAAANGNDVLARARTGTGKTLAFLVPALERLLQTPDYKCGVNVGILVVSPTRELATQISDQADKLLTFHPKNMNSQVMYGGTKMGRDTNLLNKRIPAILVATPGRLLDHLENTKLLGGRQFGHDVMKQTPILVLDETDRLLDMGFRREINKILKFLPRKEKRQTLLFSATVPQELKQIMSENMREDFIEVDCIGDGNDGSHTNVQVDQTHVILPSMDQYLSSVVQIVQSTMNDSVESHKVVVFFPAAKVVAFFAEFFNIGLGIEVIELHSKKSQSYRNKASDKFRKAKSAILFTTDVSARGVDYPDVTDVIQFGLPESRDQYIHRLGRTGRAGKAGKGLLVLAPFERKFLSELKGLDIAANEEFNNIFERSVDAQTMNSIEGVLEKIKKGDPTLTNTAQKAYQAFLGYYNGQTKRTNHSSKAEVVATANHFSAIIGLNEVPGLLARTVGKMGLKGVPGVVIDRGNQGKFSHSNSYDSRRGGDNSRKHSRSASKGRRR